MTPVGGIVVAVALFAVTVSTVFGADNVCFLECRAGKRQGRVQTVVSEEEERGMKTMKRAERKRSRYSIGKGKMKREEED